MPACAAHLILAAVVASVLACGVAPCAAQSSATPGARPFAIEVVPGHSLQSTGRGVYRDGEDGVGAFGLFAITLCTDGRRCSTLPEDAPAPAAPRTLVLDLRNAVPGSGSVPRGVVTAAKANVGAFWEQDTTTRAMYNGRQGWAIRSALDIPIGRTVASQRIEIRFFADGKQYILQFGPWTAGQYQPNQGALSGDRTTTATISRPSDTTWVARSGDQSVGRLWDNSEPARPVNLGLYAFTFEVRYAVLSRGATSPSGLERTAGSPVPGPVFPGDTLATLSQVWMDAAQRQDMRVLERLMAPEFTVVHPTEENATSRAQWLAGTARHPTRALTFEHLSVVRYGDALAIIAGILRVDALVDGRSSISRVAVTDVWQRHDGRWQVVTRHATRPLDLQ
ncbi:MAG: nuclear transport factor 2 family protein [Vicinamibacterales bacterium]